MQLACMALRTPARCLVLRPARRQLQRPKITTAAGALPPPPPGTPAFGGSGCLRSAASKLPSPARPRRLQSVEDYGGGGSDDFVENLLMDFPVEYDGGGGSDIVTSDFVEKLLMDLPGAATLDQAAYGTKLEIAKRLLLQDLFEPSAKTFAYWVFHALVADALLGWQERDVAALASLLRSWGLEGDLMSYCSHEGVFHWAPASMQQTEARVRALQEEEGLSVCLAAIVWLTVRPGSELHSLVQQMVACGTQPPLVKQLMELRLHCRAATIHFSFERSLELLHILFGGLHTAGSWPAAAAAAAANHDLLTGLGRFERQYGIGKLGQVFEKLAGAGLTAEEKRALAALAIDDRGGPSFNFATRLNSVRWIGCGGDWAAAARAVMAYPGLLQWPLVYVGHTNWGNIMDRANAAFLEDMAASGVEPQQLERLQELLREPRYRFLPEGLAPSMHAVRLRRCGDGDSWAAAVEAVLADPGLLEVAFLWD